MSDEADMLMIPFSKIDAAWAEVPPYEYDAGSLAPADALAPLLKLGIVACEECGGSGLVKSETAPCHIECPGCHGHGWKLDNAP